MPRPRDAGGRDVLGDPTDFRDGLQRLREESGLTWRQIAEMAGISELTVSRWRKGAHPSWRHMLALMDLAEGLGLAHTLPVRRVRLRR